MTNTDIEHQIEAWMQALPEDRATGEVQSLVHSPNAGH